MNQIFTIAREVGSGGLVFGKHLAKVLGCPCYDREILSEIARQSSLSESYVRGIVEHRPQPVLPLSTGQMTTLWETYAVLPAQSVYQAQREAIRTLATRSPCVVVGRCADHILQDLNPFRIFLDAELEARVDRVLARTDPSQPQPDRRKVRQFVRRADRGRARYYDFYTGVRWGDKENYDLCLNTTGADIETLAEAVAAFLRRLSPSAGDAR